MELQDMAGRRTKQRSGHRYSQAGSWGLLPHRAGRDGAPPRTGSEDTHGQPCQGLGARAEAGDAGLNPHSILSCRRYWSKDVFPPWQCQPPHGICGAAGAAFQVPVVQVLRAA